MIVTMRAHQTPLQERCPKSQEVCSEALWWQHLQAPQVPQVDLSLVPQAERKNHHQPTRKQIPAIKELCRNPVEGPVDPLHPQLEHQVL